MDICFCISGQIRGDIDTFQSLKEQVDKLIVKNNVTLIFSVWNTVTIKTSPPLGFFQLHRIFEAGVMEIMPLSYYGSKLWNHFPITYKNLSGNMYNYNIFNEINNVFPSAIIDIESENMQLEFDEKRKVGDKNTLKMLYKRWRCNQIKLKEEDKLGKKFDLVVITRPDLLININNNLEEPDVFNHKIHMKSDEDREFIDDVLIYSNSQEIDKLSNKLFSLAVASDIDYIHNALYAYAEKNKIEVVTPKYIVSKGLKSNKLLSFKDIRGDNLLLDFMHDQLYGSYFSVDDVHEMIEKVDDKFEIMSLKYILCKNYININEYKNAINTFLQIIYEMDASDFNRSYVKYCQDYLSPLLIKILMMDASLINHFIENVKDTNNDRILNNLKVIFNVDDLKSVNEIIVKNLDKK